jgi:PRTRC genetic system ThiF family protein
MAKYSTKAMIKACSQVHIVGCGGTGSILADQLCRLIKGHNLDMALVLHDGDVVENANITRQYFMPYEIGANKAEALALRLSGQFGMEIKASPENFTGGKFGNGNLVITCTDNLLSRKYVSNSFYRITNNTAWIDVGNELHHGQAVIGTTSDKSDLRQQFWRWTKEPYVSYLPNIAALNPEIVKAKKEKKSPSCADVPFLEQGFGVNMMAAQAAAALAKQVMVNGIVKNSAVFFDVEKMWMSSVAITQDTFRKWKKIN